MEIVLVANEKGGSAKTTTVLFLANCLTALGYRVAAVDMDPSGNLTCAALPEQPKYVLHDVFSNTVPLQDAIVHTEICDILPTAKETVTNGLVPGDPVINFNSKSLGQIADRWVGRAGAEYMLATYLRKYPNYNLADHYDFVFIDSAPSDNILVRNAIIAADSVIVPCDPYSGSLDGLVMFLNSVKSVQACYKTSVRFDGLLLSKYSEDWGSQKKVIANIKKASEMFGIRCYKTKIRESGNFPDAFLECRPILDYIPGTGNAVVDSMNMALEFLEVRGMEPLVDFPGVQKDENGHLFYERPKRNKKTPKKEN